MKDHAGWPRAGLIAVALVFMALQALGCGAAWATLIFTSDVLSGPNNILKGGSATYTLSLGGTGAGAGTSLQFSVFADAADPPVLIDDTPFTVADDAAGNWSFTTQFTLRCTTDCMIMGSTTEKAASPANISALIEQEISRGNFRNVSSSNEIMVNCVTCLPRQEVPIPASGSLFLVGQEFCPIAEPSSVALMGIGCVLMTLTLVRVRKSPDPDL